MRNVLITKWTMSCGKVVLLAHANAAKQYEQNHQHAGCIENALSASLLFTWSPFHFCSIWNESRPSSSSNGIVVLDSCWAADLAIANEISCGHKFDEGQPWRTTAMADRKETQEHSVERPEHFFQKELVGEEPPSFTTMQTLYHLATDLFAGRP